MNIRLDFQNSYKLMKQNEETLVYESCNVNTNNLKEYQLSLIKDHRVSLNRIPTYEQYIMRLKKQLQNRKEPVFCALD